ncbi:MAG: type II toxin-antitoxin system RelE/ParE family toxin [Candidatus Kerfeldbacteria bacterium]|nr:type II toxin-antitoxin system RelE/ParE family toxin [Candidatus Kerfeldbacteria bacterium]
MYAVYLHPRAAKSLRKIDSRYLPRIKRALRSLEFHPHIGKALGGELEGSFVIRVWPYRIIYTIDNGRLVVAVIDIAHRQGAYK